MQRKYRVGRECQAWCTKCKEMVTHTVIAMVGKLPKRVECETCGSQHNFRLPASKARPVRSSSRSAGRVPRGGWKSVLAELEGDHPARSYQISERFAVNDIVQHPTFGTGVVRSVIPGGKIEVLFEDGSKTLAHAR